MITKPPINFDYPVVYPNGVIIWVDTKEEQERLQQEIAELENTK